MKKTVLTWEHIDAAIQDLNLKNERVYGVPKGGMIVAGLAKQTFPDIQLIMDPWETKPDLILDDLIDSGATQKKYKARFPGVSFESLFDKRDMDGNPWIVLPWETDHPAGVDSIQQNIVRMLEYIGEDPNREGLLDTPKRIVKSWDELFAGYGQDPKELLRHFDAETYDQIVLLKDIELYSMCEHHMLVFSGIAHVAYIPDKRVIGISKLARLVDIYARRLQIQERIGEQVTSFLMDELNALGAACIIEASHMCLAGDTKIHLAYMDRSIYPEGIPIKDLVGIEDSYVYCFNKETNKIDIDKINSVWRVGEKEVYEVFYEWDIFNQHKKITKTGSIKVTKDHPFMLRNKKHNRYNNKTKPRIDGSFMSIEQGLEVGDGLMPFTVYEGQPGYSWILFNDGTFAQEHTFLLENKLNRKLEKREVGHHNNENTRDNQWDNLQCLTKAEHNSLHNKGTKRPRNKPAWNRKERKPLVCIGCGDQFTTQYKYQEKTQSYCSHDCYLRNRNHRITEIKYAGKEDVFDMETEKHHNFAANDIIVHNCMRMRGCSKQRSTMVTSSLKGVFFKKPEARQELMQLIKG